MRSVPTPRCATPRHARGPRGPAGLCGAAWGSEGLFGAARGRADRRACVSGIQVFVPLAPNVLGPLLVLGGLRQLLGGLPRYRRRLQLGKRRDSSQAMVQRPAAGGRERERGWSASCVSLRFPHPDRFASQLDPPAACLRGRAGTRRAEEGQGSPKRPRAEMQQQHQH